MAYTHSTVTQSKIMPNKFIAKAFLFIFVTAIAWGLSELNRNGFKLLAIVGAGGTASGAAFIACQLDKSST